MVCRGGISGGEQGAGCQQRISERPRMPDIRIRSAGGVFPASDNG